MCLALYESVMVFCTVSSPHTLHELLMEAYFESGYCDLYRRCFPTYLLKPVQLNKNKKCIRTSKSDKGILIRRELNMIY